MGKPKSGKIKGRCQPPLVTSLRQGILVVDRFVISFLSSGPGNRVSSQEPICFVSSRINFPYKCDNKSCKLQFVRFEKMILSLAHQLVTSSK